MCAPAGVTCIFVCFFSPPDACRDLCECLRARMRLLPASSTHATLRYLNWRQLRFQATIKRRPGGQSSGRKQTHLRQSGLCGGMTYAPTCQPGLAGFDSPGAAAAPPVHYVLACIVPLSRSECWLLVQREICTSESMS